MLKHLFIPCFYERTRSILFSIVAGFHVHHYCVARDRLHCRIKRAGFNLNECVQKCEKENRKICEERRKRLFKRKYHRNIIQKSDKERDEGLKKRTIRQSCDTLMFIFFSLSNFHLLFPFTINFCDHIQSLSPLPLYSFGTPFFFISSSRFYRVLFYD